MAERRHAVWVYYRTVDGRRVVADEVRDTLPAKGPERALEAWNRLLTMVRDGSAVPGKDFKQLKGTALLEARLSWGGQQMRLLYSKTSDGQLVLLGLCAFKKKSQKTPKQQIETAEARLADWKRRHTR